MKAVFCLNCGKELEISGTKPRRYCSDSCRKAHGRKRTKDSGHEKTDRRENPIFKKTDGVFNLSKEGFFNIPWIEGETPNAHYAREFKEFLRLKNDWEHSKRYSTFLWEVW